MRHGILTLTLTAALATAPATAQDSDGGIVERSLESNLSADGRIVQIEGFEGALSSQARLSQLTVADADGVWLSLRNVTLDWNRAALLRGRVEVDELRAEEIVFTRTPLPTESMPDPEASGFSLPELPVSVRIGTLQADRISLGAALFGRAAELSLEGSLGLEGGEGQGALTAERIDGQRGSFVLEGAFSNATRVLTLDLQLDEGADGIAANLLNIQERPPLRLDLEGEGPLGDFAASLSLATDGTERLAGDLTIGTAEDGAQRFSAALAGDIAPLLAPRYRDFFGTRVTLNLAGSQAADGALDLSAFALRTAALDLEGTLQLAPDGLPTAFGIEGEIAAEDGTPVLLPVSGDPTQVQRVSLTAAFDAAQDDAWSARFDIEALDRPGFAAERATLDGAGSITRSPSIGVTADLDFTARALDLGDPAAKAALGETVSGLARITWAENAPLQLSRLEITGETYSFDGEATVTTEADTVDVTTRARIAATDLSVFSGLADRALSGAADFELSGSIAPIAGTFDLTMQGRTENAVVSQAEADALLAGTATLSGRVLRAQDGVTFERLRLQSDAATLDASGQLATDASRLNGEVTLRHTDILAPGLTGPLDLNADIDQGGPLWDVNLELTGPDLAAAIVGRIDTDPASPVFEGRITADLASIDPLAARFGQPFRGAVALQAEGRAAADLQTLDITAEIATETLQTGIAEIDRILAGRATLTGGVTRDGANFGADALRFDAPTLSATADGGIAAESGSLTVTARLADLAPFAPGLSGPLSVEGTLGRGAGGQWLPDVAATGPAGSTARVAGTATPDLQSFGLDIAGRAPLALANRFIAPRAVIGDVGFDLRLAGPPALSSLSGQVSTQGARLVAPAAGLVLEDIRATVGLSGEQAQLDVTGQVQGGGRVALQGPVALGAPNPGSLDITLADVFLSDPTLYETRVGGRIRIDGPLAGGAALTGRLTLGETEVRVSTQSGGGLNDIPEITHVGEPPAVRATRDRAGLIQTGPAGSGGGPAFPLDLTVTAPNRIFIRGLGLDAELGGEIGIGGTTDDVIPEGQFELIRGRLDILSRRLTLTEGRVTLQGTFDPFLFLVATSRANEITVRVVIEGLASAPDIRFTSEPELPEDEVISRLLFGRGVETLSPLQAAQLAAAVASLAGGGGADIVGRLRQNFGLDDLDVTTGEDGATAVRAGRYLSDEIYTDVTVDSTGGSEVSLNLDLTPSITLKGTVDDEGETGVGVFFERDY